VVERAEAFLNERLGDSVSIAQLCRVAGVSERSLRNAFYDVRGMSPKRCAVRARLAEVRRALRHATVARGAVTTVATDHGFFELGRFASTYKAVFGESPSETLRGRSNREAAA
jgi:AraC family ethanolamine operon transcriptional activator